MMTIRMFFVAYVTLAIYMDMCIMGKQKAVYQYVFRFVETVS